MNWTTQLLIFSLRKTKSWECVCVKERAERERLLHHIFQLTLRTVTESFISGCWMKCDASSDHFRPRKCSSVCWFFVVDTFYITKHSHTETGTSERECHSVSSIFVSGGTVQMENEQCVSIAKRVHKTHMYELWPWWKFRKRMLHMR